MDAILDAMHANMLRAERRIGCLTDSSALAEPGAWLLIDAGVGLPRFNHALVAGPVEDAAPAVAAAFAWFEERGAEPTFVLRDPMDAAVAAIVARQGFALAETEPAMLLADLDSVAPSAAGLTILPVHDEPDIVRYAEVDAPAWHVVTRGIARTARDFPDFTMLLGETGGEAVATSMAVVTGQVVGIYNVQVRPDHRNRGFGRAMTAAAIEAGRRAGCTHAALRSSHMGLRLYQQMGFREQYSVSVYARPGALD